MSEIMDVPLPRASSNPLINCTLRSVRCMFKAWRKEWPNVLHSTYPLDLPHFNIVLVGRLRRHADNKVNVKQTGKYDNRRQALPDHTLLRSM